MFASDFLFIVQLADIWLKLIDCEATDKPDLHFTLLTLVDTMSERNTRFIEVTERLTGAMRETKKLE